MENLENKGRENNSAEAKEVKGYHKGLMQNQVLKQENLSQDHISPDLVPLKTKKGKGKIFSKVIVMTSSLKVIEEKLLHFMTIGACDKDAAELDNEAEDASSLTNF